MTHAGARDNFRLIEGSTSPLAGPGPAPIPLIPAHPGYEHLTARERTQRPGVATRAALLKRLALLETIAPEAPVSLVLVSVDGLGELDEIDPLNAPIVMAEIAAALSRLTRATDLVGRVENGTFGVVLQGRAAGSAALIGARIGHHLNVLPLIRYPLSVRVGVASGTGANADVLIAAASDSLASHRRPVN